MPTQITDTIRFERATQATRALGALGQTCHLLAAVLDAACEPLQHALDDGAEDLVSLADQASAAALTAMRTLLRLRLDELEAGAASGDAASEALEGDELIEAGAFAEAAALLGQLRAACRP